MVETGRDEMRPFDQRASFIALTAGIARQIAQVLEGRVVAGSDGFHENNANCSLTGAKLLR